MPCGRDVMVRGNARSELRHDVGRGVRGFGRCVSKAMTRWMVASVGLVLLASVSVGCARRELTVTSEPSGALVYLNQVEAGRTPFTMDFTFYGRYDVRVEHAEHATVSEARQLTAPWWQWPPFDFFAELAPWRPVDRQTMHFVLPAREPSDATGLIKRAEAMRERLPGAED